MAIKINREMAGDLNNPSSELLNHCINQHQSDFWRLEKLSDYYDGKQDILKRKKIVLQHLIIKLLSITQSM